MDASQAKPSPFDACVWRNYRQSDVDPSPEQFRGQSTAEIAGIPGTDVGSLLRLLHQFGLESRLPGFSLCRSHVIALEQRPKRLQCPLRLVGLRPQNLASHVFIRVSGEVTYLTEIV